MSLSKYFKRTLVDYDATGDIRVFAFNVVWVQRIEECRMKLQKEVTPTFVGFRFIFFYF